MTDFYQSPGDKLRLDILLKTLSEGNLNLAILGEDDIALAHYARRIAQHLRQQAAIEVELWTSADSEKLVQRFNEILAELSVHQALDKSQKAVTKRYMIFPDAQSIQDIDLQLLARLINGFPASNIHVILLANSLEPCERKLAAFGKNLMQWVLEAENPSPKRAQRIETRDEELSPAAVPSATPASMEEVIPSANSWELPQPAEPKGNSRMAWGLLVGLVVSLVVFGLLYQEQIKTEMEAMQAYLSRTVSGKAKEPAPAATPSLGMSSTTQLPVKPDDSLIPDKEALIKSEPPAVAEKLVTQPEPPAPSAPTAAVEPPVPAGKVDSPVPPERDDKAWVEKLPSTGWVLQHAAFDTAQEMALFQSKQAAFREAKVVKTKRKSGATYFILLTGPYASRQEAENLIKTNPAMSKSWLRATKSVKAQVQE
jgi:septal ring-binding cell division protein DamX